MKADAEGPGTEAGESSGAFAAWGAGPPAAAGGGEWAGAGPRGGPSGSGGVCWGAVCGGDARPGRGLRASAGCGEAEETAGGAAGAAGVGSDCVELVSGALPVVFWRTGPGSGAPRTGAAEGTRAGAELGSSGETEKGSVWGSVMLVRSGSTSGSGAKPAPTAGAGAPVAGATVAGAPVGGDAAGATGPAELGFSGTVAIIAQDRQR